MITSKQVDYLNIGLILLSIFIAFRIPYELFLFSYAVLGPLHYLTEINWLNERGYFTKSRKTPWLLVATCALLSLVIIYYELPKWPITLPFFNAIDIGIVHQGMSTLGPMLPIIIFTSFVCGIAYAAIENKWIQYSVIAAALGISYLLYTYPMFELIVSGMIPTVIHVYIFTGIFMLYGALKNDSLPGYFSILIFILCTLSIVFAHIVPAKYKISQDVIQQFIHSSFYITQYQLSSIFGETSPNIELLSKSNIKWQIFIAFAYTYHYLNWFSKTSIIKWHEVSKKKMGITILVWLISIMLYYYNYRLGFMVLLFLSFLHVFLEFPLNYQSIIGIGTELKKKIIKT